MTDIPEATAALTAAIQAHAEATGNVPLDDSMLSSFVVVAHWVGIAEAGTGGYSMHYQADTSPHHVVHGLLVMGGKLLDTEGEED